MPRLDLDQVQNKKAGTYAPALPIFSIKILLFFRESFGNYFTIQLITKEIHSFLKS